MWGPARSVHCLMLLSPDIQLIGDHYCSAYYFWQTDWKERLPQTGFYDAMVADSLTWLRIYFSVMSDLDRWRAVGVLIGRAPSEVWR